MKANMLYHSTLFQKARRRAMAYEGDIFPGDCMEILKDVYGARLDLMKPMTIYRLVLALMDIPDPDEVDRKYIKEEVNDFINS